MTPSELRRSHKLPLTKQLSHALTNSIVTFASIYEELCGRILVASLMSDLKIQA